MTEPDETQGSAEAASVEMIEHRGYKLRITKTPLDWVVFVARPGERPTIIVAPDRESAMEKAREWVDGQLAAGDKRL